MTASDDVTDVMSAYAYRDNGRRLMDLSGECYDEGMHEAGAVLRALSRIEYRRALSLLERRAVA